MNNVFGVSSSVPANTRLKNGYTMYDWVMRKSCFPAFWGRTLIGDNPITKEEIEFLRDKDCKILLIDQSFCEREVSGNSGVASAYKTVEAAKKLNIPQYNRIAIFVEIKPEWSVNHNWMIDYAQTMLANGYIPGFIGNTDSSKNFNFDRQCSHYVYATSDSMCYSALYGATEPKLDCAPTNWEPFCPSALTQKDIDLWMCGNISFDNLTVDTVYAQRDNILDNMW